ncbi:tetratricopeptide repeat protein 5 [Erpetoichthys calabaricus]|uniref:Tetratricopeptide repeat domain 5 n=1 Tax=Erpetoichthys calabaricus TaxID=27687 RepID=A0A8C4RUW7_ERPCA|nr:tetratricopeptide repeat protein 5 [Erpetoichthys calabaricus]
MTSVMDDAEKGDGDALDVLRELVDGLYSFRDHYFDTHSVDEASRKQSDVALEMEKVLKKLNEMEGQCNSRAQFLLLKGRTLNIVAQYSPDAEEALSKAVKLDPSLVDAWNQLGEVYWKKGDLTGAQTCFSGALSHCENKVSLRNLSMVLRQIRTSGEDYSTNVFESVNKAKQAVQLDIKDGTSWYILGNAYLSLFFISGQNPKMSQQALSSYAQAEKMDRTASCNQDLHFNRATLYQYEELYEQALEGFSQASALDPSWLEPPVREQQLLDFLDRLSTLLQNKGKVKAKRLQSLLSSLRASDLGPCCNGQYQTPSGQQVKLEKEQLRVLKSGVNAGVAVLGKVVFSLTPEQKVPFTFGLVDTEGSCCAVMVYNMAESWGVLIGDSVAIPEPHVKNHHISHKAKTYTFQSIRVESPLMLVVNGKKQAPTCQVAATVSYKPQSD